MVVLAFAWGGFEALRYFFLLRRRQALGLADPVVTNRFLLWAIADWTEISQAAVKKRLHTARKRLKERMIRTMKEDIRSHRPSKDAKFAKGVRQMLLELCRDGLDKRFPSADADARRRAANHQADAIQHAHHQGHHQLAAHETAEHVVDFLDGVHRLVAQAWRDEVQ